MKLITKNDFISAEEAAEIKAFARPPANEILNYHVKSVNEETMGWSAMYDFSGTEVSRLVTMGQGDGTRMEGKPPALYEELGHRIAKEVGVSDANMFFQYVVVGPGGSVRKHYDVGCPGYVTYKCNVCVEGPADDVINVDGVVVPVPPLGLYCFEASLYKHWMGKADVTRVHLSYGFIVPCEELGWAADSPRVRFSNRIWKSYLNKK